MAFNQSLCDRITGIADQLSEAALTGDFDRVQQLDHTLRHTALELIATMELQGETATDGLDALIDAMTTVKKTAELVDEERKKLNMKFKKDVKLRLVYSSKG